MPYLGVAGGAAGVHDGAQVIRLGADGFCGVLPAQIQKVIPFEHLQSCLLLNVLQAGHSSQPEGFADSTLQTQQNM